MPRIPNVSSSAARKAPMLAAPNTWMPCAIAHRISFYQIVGDKARDLAKTHRHTSASERIEQRIADFGFGRLLVFRRRQVVANAGDIGQPGLCRLGQGAAERDCPIGMAAGTVVASQAPRIA